jgi:hypothetical protein
VSSPCHPSSACDPAGPEPGKAAVQSAASRRQLSLRPPDRLISATFAGGGELGLDAAGDVFVAPGPGWTSKEAELSPAGQVDPAVTPAAITAASGPTLLPSGQFVAAATIAQGRGESHVQVTRYNPGSTVASTSALLSWTGANGKDAGTAAGTPSGGRP